MRKGMWLTYALTCLAFTPKAFGGYFKVEVPAYLEAEDVLNATDSVKAELDSLLREEIARYPAEVNNAAVVFTKNGELIYPEVERTETDGWSDNRLGFHAAGEFLNRPGSWDAAYWHLREVGQPDYNGVYALAEDMFGYPFWTSDITVEWDPTLPLAIDGYYHITNEIIYLREWRNWDLPGWQQDPDWNDDAAVLTRCMLQAWHHRWQAYWDHFGSMRRAAWIAIHNKLGDDGYELGFNDLYHDDQRDDRPYYKCLDNYNTEELGTRLANWADPNSQIDGRIKYWRYGAANYCWWKVYRKQPQFIYRFNEQAYYYGFGIFRFFYSFWQSFAEEADNGTPIEGRPFPDWFARQPILQYDHWNDDICALALDRTTARVLAYRRFIDGATGEWCEIAHSNARVYTEKQNWQGQMEHYHVIDVLPGGYGEWDFPIDNPDEGIKVTASYNLQGGPSISDMRWGIDSDAAYEVDALYGVVTDAFGGGGTVTIKKGGVVQATVPVFKKAFRWTPLSATGPGEYELVYTPPRGGGGRAYSPQRIVKDVASYFSDRNYTYDSDPGDLDNNGIPDGVEAALAAKFCPCMKIHCDNPMIPQTVNISLDTGYYGRYTGGQYEPWDWIKPGGGTTMRDIIEGYGYGQDTDFISFGSEKNDIDQHTYWENEYDRLFSEGYNEPYVYFNIFKHQGKPVIQFWFYYPYNWWRNDHEGDWEHINVRVSTPDPTRAYLEEVIYYFHKKRKSLPRSGVEFAVGEHPQVYLGGRPYDWDFGASLDYDWGESSGGSYWRDGIFLGVAFDTEEYILPSVNEIWHDDFNKVWIGKCTGNSDFWWLNFRGRWGRAERYLNDFSEWKGSGIRSPWHHECWRSYQHPDYSEYSIDRGTAPTPPLAGAGAPTPPSDAEPFGPPVATVGPSPSAGDYLSPTVGDYPSPFARAPLGPGSDAPGADVPPTDAPGLTSPSNLGGDSLSPGGAAAPFERRGPLAAAAPASPLACKPNPVTATATISFKLEMPSRVSLAVYDLSGRRVATLAEGSYAAGEHAAYWHANVPTGVYIYRLQAGDKVAVKKVVVAK